MTAKKRTWVQDFVDRTKAQYKLALNPSDWRARLGCAAVVPGERIYFYQASRGAPVRITRYVDHDVMIELGRIRGSRQLAADLATILASDHVDGELFRASPRVAEVMHGALADRRLRLRPHGVSLAKFVARVTGQPPAAPPEKQAQVVEKIAKNSKIENSKMM